MASGISSNEALHPESSGDRSDPCTEGNNADVTEANGSVSTEQVKDSPEEGAIKEDGKPEKEDQPLLEKADGHSDNSSSSGSEDEDTSDPEALSMPGAEEEIATTSELRDSSSQEAPPLPEKRPLPSSTEDLADPEQGRDDDSSSQSSRDGGQDAASSSQPEPEVSPVQSSQVTVTVEPTTSTSPNEPPPPYPGGPQALPGRDPYDGTPGDDRIVLVQRTGNCPKCQVGNIIKNYSFCGICLAIWLFPCGLICLFCLRQRKCSHCGAKF